MSDPAAIGFEVSRRATSTEWAFLESCGTVYFSRSEPGFAPIDSPVLKLIGGIHEAWPEKARALSRNRIYTGRALSESDQGLLRVAAKRATGGVAPVEGELSGISAWQEVTEVPLRGFFPGGTALRLSEGDALQRALKLGREADRTGQRHLSDRPVGAVLLSAEGALLAEAVNTNGRNRVLHAEINLLRGLSAAGSRLPPGARLYVGLKPCRMCAALIWESRDPSGGLSVEFAEDDPGPGARNTLLDRKHCSRQVSDLK